MKSLTLILMLLASPSVADGLSDYDPNVLVSCINEQTSVAGQVQCIGVGANACLETDSGTFTAGMYSCYSAELYDWDDRLNAIYKRVLDGQVTLRDETAGSGQNLSDPVEKLRIMQRAWIVYRDTACDWEWRQWSGGTGGGPAVAECHMRLTAQQSIFLEARL